MSESDGDNRLIRALQADRIRHYQDVYAAAITEIAELASQFQLQLQL